MWSLQAQRFEPAFCRMCSICHVPKLTLAATFRSTHRELTAKCGVWGRGCGTEAGGAYGPCQGDPWVRLSQQLMAGLLEAHHGVSRMDQCCFNVFQELHVPLSQTSCSQSWSFRFSTLDGARETHAPLAASTQLGKLGAHYILSLSPTGGIMD